LPYVISKNLVALFILHTARSGWSQQFEPSEQMAQVGNRMIDGAEPKVATMTMDKVWAHLSENNFIIFPHDKTD